MESQSMEEKVSNQTNKELTPDSVDSVSSQVLSCKRVSVDQLQIELTTLLHHYEAELDDIVIRLSQPIDACIWYGGELSCNKELMEEDPLALPLVTSSTTIDKQQTDNQPTVPLVRAVKSVPQHSQSKDSIAGDQFKSSQINQPVIAIKSIPQTTTKANLSFSNQIEESENTDDDDNNSDQSEETESAQRFYFARCPNCGLFMLTEKCVQHQEEKTVISNCTHCGKTTQNTCSLTQHLWVVHDICPTIEPEAFENELVIFEDIILSNDHLMKPNQIVYNMASQRFEYPCWQQEANHLLDQAYCNYFGKPITSETMKTPTTMATSSVNNNNNNTTISKLLLKPNINFKMCPKCSLFMYQQVFYQHRKEGKFVSSCPHCGESTQSFCSRTRHLFEVHGIRPTIKPETYKDAFEIFQEIITNHNNNNNNDDNLLRKPKNCIVYHNGRKRFEYPYRLKKANFRLDQAYRRRAGELIPQSETLASVCEPKSKRNPYLIFKQCPKCNLFVSQQNFYRHCKEYKFVTYCIHCNESTQNICQRTKHLWEVHGIRPTVGSESYKDSFVTFQDIQTKANLMKSDSIVYSFVRKRFEYLFRQKEANLLLDHAYQKYLNPNTF